MTHPRAGLERGVDAHRAAMALDGLAHDCEAEAGAAATLGAEVTETEMGDGNAAYEVELRLDDGSQVEVELDERFIVIGSSPDDDDGTGTDDDDGPGDDND